MKDTQINNSICAIGILSIILFSGCCKNDLPDSTVYGNITMIAASEETIAYGKKRYPPEDKAIFTKDGYPAFLEYLKSRGEDLNLGFTGKLQFELDSTLVCGRKVYSFGAQDYDRIILYIHGGAYAINAYQAHFEMAKDIADKIGRTRVVLPVYPLAPQHNWSDSFELLDKLYAGMLNEKKPVIIMGDSAGGGLSMAFCQHLYLSGRPLPHRRILLSPWLDITFANPEAETIEPRDLMLGIYGLKQLGLIWKGDLEETDYRVSPLFGEFEDRIPTMIVVGTNEIMLPDCNTAYNRLVARKCRTTMVYGIGLWHVFPTSATPEAVEAKKLIADFCRNSD